MHQWFVCSIFLYHRCGISMGFILIVNSQQGNGQLKKENQLIFFPRKDLSPLVTSLGPPLFSSVDLLAQLQFSLPPFRLPLPSPPPLALPLPQGSHKGTDTVFYILLIRP